MQSGLTERKVFALNSLIAYNRDDTQSNHCPICNSRFIRVIANHNYTRLLCINCQWTEYYMRIQKKGEMTIE